MDFWQIFFLAILQGLTEFLPISSSGHLALVPHLTGWADQGLAFDVAVHVGSLLAVLWYFRKELYPLTSAWFNSVLKRLHTSESRLAWAVIFGTIPTGLAGLIAGGYIDANLRSTQVIAAATVLFGLLLGMSDITGRRERDEYALRWQDVLIIGLGQALALIPGTSRSGITITMGLFMGLTRQAAARFSFLLSIPIITLAGGVKTIELIQQAEPVVWSNLLLGAAFSGISAYLCIHAFISLLDRIGMWPFVIYRLLLGAILFFWFI